ncbi:U3 small nucleolar RNA-associated protein 15 homolog [Centruroides sculpturatus]|uniref:U3 small nucleolar RNA-associated protein 15 homolog n=1 Tax=Centruroides sculpturatus TaxID=218467 RepID=UPI000C6EE36C|nr:U3 small nucleolar RNA-associated protein 15 homolog [Centruroides sculpturatus]
MADFKRTEILSFPTSQPKATLESKYWKNYEFPISVKDYGPIDYLDFSPEPPYYFAASCSSRVQIYSPKNNDVCRSLSRFRQTAYGGSFRHDGLLLVAGGDDGNVQLYEVKSRSLLRIFKDHKAATHRCKFTKEGTRIVSFSDDKSVNLWDVPSESKILTLQEHQDYIRAGAISKASEDIFISGSYDHTVKMYDARTSKSILSVDHGCPVESVLMFPSGGVFVSAGGTTIKVWDSVAGRQLAQLSQHHKTITCLCFANDNKRVMSGSLDRHVKIYDVLTYQVVHTLDFPSPLLSIAISPKDKIITGGMTNGLISISHQKSLIESEKKVRKKGKKPLMNYYIPDKEFYPEQEDIKVPHKDRKLYAAHDQNLRRFQHTKALDIALKSKKPEVVASILSELMRRNRLKAALVGRDEKSINPLMKYLVRYIGDPRFSRILLDVAIMFVDIYSTNINEHVELVNQFNKLKTVVDKEVSYIEETMEVLGAINCIINNSKQFVS